MGLEFPAPVSDRRFPPGQDHAKRMFVMTSIIDSDSASNESYEAEVTVCAVRPKAANWLWRPWYAKVWWTGIVAYWAGKGASMYSPTLDTFYTSVLAGFLNILFFPPLALMVLGLGLARAWFDASDWEFVEPTQEQMFPKRSAGGMRDPYADPLDPRSGVLHWRRVDGSP